MKWITISKAVMGRKKVVYTLDNKPSSLKQIQHATQEDSLRHALGDYIRGGEAHRAGISYNTLRKWRSSGRLRAKKIKATWYYSRQDLLELIAVSLSHPNDHASHQHQDDAKRKRRLLS